MFLSKIATRIRTALTRRSDDQPFTPPSLMMNPRSLQQVREVIESIRARAARDDPPLNELLPRIEPWLRIAAKSGEVQDLAMLAAHLMHKARWLDNEGDDPVGGIVAAVEALTILGRMANGGLDEAVAPYRHFRSWASEPVRRHVTNVLMAEAEQRRAPEPEVVIAEIQRADLEELG